MIHLFIGSISLYNNKEKKKTIHTYYKSQYTITHKLATKSERIKIQFTNKSKKKNISRYLSYDILIETYV